jgi:hypothetical protein
MMIFPGGKIAVEEVDLEDQGWIANQFESKEDGNHEIKFKNYK